MSAGRFAVGTELWINGRPARVVSAADPTKADVEFSPSGERQQVDLPALYYASAIRWVPPLATTADSEPSLVKVSEEEWAEARERLAIIQPLLEGEDIERRVKETAAQTKNGRRTLYRWMHDYRTAGLRGLVPHYKARGGGGKTRLDPTRETLLNESLKRHYLRRERPTIKLAFEQVCVDFLEKALAAPGLHTVRARIASLNARQHTAAREGGRAARAKHNVVQGHFPAQSHPLQTILIDHTPLDILLVDAVDRTKVIGRPFLTLAADALTRMVFGYYLTLDPPSYLSVAMCLLQGVLPKADVIQKFGLQRPWPIFGLPQRAYMDNGKDFHAKHLERFAEQYEIHLEYRPVRQPWWGGQIERVIGTVNRTVHHLPGTTKSSVAAKGDYDAEAHAVFTIDEIEAHLARNIVERYHCEIHSELGKSPLQAWEDATGSGRFVPALPPDIDRFRIDLLPYEERTIQREGLALFGLDYADGFLQTLRGLERRGSEPAKHVVKYDPRDLSKVWIIVEDGTSRPIHLSNRTIGSLSKLELDRVRRLAKTEGRKFSMSNLADLLQRDRKALAEATAKTQGAKRAARVTARIDQSRRTGTPPAEASEAVRPAAATVAMDAEMLTRTAPEDDVLSGALVLPEGWGAPTLNYGRSL